MLLEEIFFNGAQMQARVFIGRVMPDGQAAGESDASVARISALSPQAARTNKRTLRTLNPTAIRDTPMNPTTCLVDQIQRQAYAYADSAEHREGITAFLEKRQASF